jgi:hypothetical protein
VESLANIKVIFFLASKSDQRKLFAGLEKKNFYGASLKRKAGLASETKTGL